MILGRRFAAILMGLTLLQPGAVLADAVCDAHDTTVSQAPVDAPHSHDQMASQDDDSSVRESCHDVPPRTDCCLLLASCGTEPGVGVVVRASELPAGKCLRSGADIARPMSFLAAPEPPPPRA